MKPIPATARRTASVPALLTVLVPAMLLMVIASDMVNLVLPPIGEEFGVSEARLAWVVTGFLLVFSIGIPFYGRLSDRVGLRRLFCVALLVYAAGSLICALAPEFIVLVAGRVVMGSGAAAIPVLSVVTVTRVLPAAKRGTGIGFISAAAGVGTAAGPAVGGGIGQLLGWPALFWLTLLFALALIPGAVRVLPADSPGDARPFDAAGGVFLGLAAGLLLFGVTQAQGAGFTSPSSVGSLLAAVAAAGLFAWRTRAARHPFVSPELFANRTYTAALLTVFLAMFVNLTILVFVPVLVVEVNGLNPGYGSLVMIPGGVALAVLSPLAGRLSSRTGPKALVIAGLLTITLSAAVLSAFAGASPVPAAVAVLGLGAGFAFVITNVTDIAAGALPDEQIGVGLGIFQGAQFLGAGTGPALLGALIAARQGSGDALNPVYALRAPAYSDAFLVLTLVAVFALAVALRLGRRPDRVRAR